MRRIHVLKELLRASRHTNKNDYIDFGPSVALSPSLDSFPRCPRREVRTVSEGACQHTDGTRQAHAGRAPQASATSHIPEFPSRVSTAQLLGRPDAHNLRNLQLEHLFRPAASRRWPPAEHATPLQQYRVSRLATPSLITLRLVNSLTQPLTDQLRGDYAVVPGSTGANEAQNERSSSVDIDYRSPTERVWPASKRQQKFAARVRDAMEAALLVDRVGGELVGSLGFAIEEVRMDPDNAKAFILWDAYPNMANNAQFELKRRLPAIRRSVAKYLKTRRVPQLEFRHNSATEQQEEVEDVLQRLESERNLEQRQAAQEGGTA